MATVNNTFWRLEPERGTDPASLIQAPMLISPVELLAKVRRLDGIVLASWDPDQEHGRVHALGVVQEIDKERAAVVDWRPFTFTLRPSASGSTQWRMRPFFQFAGVVADRYRLRDHFADAFTAEVADLPRTQQAEVSLPNQAVAVSVPPAATQRTVDPGPVDKGSDPQCNRVAPDGTIFATRHRGMFMGNRTSPPRWLVCDLHFQRDLKVPRKYTKLFFLDEAVALAAGHRPCKTCRSDRYDAYLVAAKAELGISGAAELDALLNAARRAPKSRGRLASFPEGTYVSLGNNDFRLLWRGAVHRWTPAGYVDPIELADLEREQAAVLTPEPSLVALRNGYLCEVHASANHR